MAIWRMCLASLAAASMLALTACGNREPEAVSYTHLTLPTTPYV